MLYKSLVPAGYIYSTTSSPKDYGTFPAYEGFLVTSIITSSSNYLNRGLHYTLH